MTGPPPDGDARATRYAVASFVVAALAAAGLGVVYGLGGDTRLEGGLLLLSFGALGTGLVVIGRTLLSAPPTVEERHDFSAPIAAEEALEHDVGRARPVTRRRLLIGSMAAAVGALLGVAFFPIRSLGPRPGRALLQTPWRAGMRAVTADGSPVRADGVPIGGLVTIFPAVDPGSADGQAVLIRLGLSARNRLTRPAPGGLIAYSKVCTHAGCPVGLYQVETQRLICPCHQSAFDVLRGAEPVFGPAARPLPQLPLTVDDEGFVRAADDFEAPVGPAWWSMP